MHVEQLRESIAADPTAPVIAGIQGLGGYGKSALLDELARTYWVAGVRVVADPAEPLDGAAVLVDDAHRLDEDTLRELHKLALRSDTRLIVTYRPWPRSAVLGELVTTLGRLGPPLLLAALGSDQIASYVENTFGVPAPREWLEWLRVQTGGVPRLVSRVLAGMTSAEFGCASVPQRALEQFRHDLDQLYAPARECLSAMATGATPHPELLGSLLGFDTGAVLEAMSAVRASGLVDANDAVLPITRDAVALLTPSERRLQLVRGLVETQIQRGGPVLDLIRPLLDAEVALVPEATMATAFEKAGEEALAESPRLACRLFEAAVSAGMPGKEVMARQAHAAAAAGDLDKALRLADQVLANEDVADRALGVRVAASVLAQRGLISRSAELCRWSVKNLRWPGDLSYAVVGMIAAGRLDEAEELMLTPSEVGPPTLLSGAATQLADGIRESVTGSATIALSTLVRAASLSEPVGRANLAPDSAASIATVVGLHCGEFDVAESMLDRAIETGTGGPLLRRRHELLAAWIPLVRGDTATTRAKLSAAIGDGNGIQVRDRLLATAIEAGIANRDNDTGALTAVRGQARKVIAEHTTDLFTLLPLGELVVAAARLHDQDWVAPYVREARELLDRLGNPPLWSSLLLWKCMQSAVILEDLDSAQQHATELEQMAHHNPMSAAMAEAAGTWLRVLHGKVDQQEAEQAARGLHSAGLTWDGARLAGQAAIRTSDRPAMLALLECARALQGKPARPRAMPGGSVSETTTRLLSDREKEVAELVLSGQTYKQVGKRLFISAKTVEHHIGRIKQRLGCSSREDLMARLRELFERE